jgi:vacuolar-type H+-ATPase subunit D/Vma8
MCFVDLVKKKYAYDSVKKIKQYLDENETHETLRLREIKGI